MLVNNVKGIMVCGALFESIWGRWWNLLKWFLWSLFINFSLHSTSWYWSLVTHTILPWENHGLGFFLTIWLSSICIGPSGQDLVALNSWDTDSFIKANLQASPSLSTGPHWCFLFPPSFEKLSDTTDIIPCTLG